MFYFQTNALGFTPEFLGTGAPGRFPGVIGRYQFHLSPSISFTLAGEVASMQF